MGRKLPIVAEMTGTSFLVFAVVGSGMMAQSLTQDAGLQLAINSAATVMVLYVLINLIAPLSGAHFNPLVTLLSLLRKERSVVEAIGYVLSQVVGAILGSHLAHLIFATPFAFSTEERTGLHLLLAEVLATFGLLMIVFADWKRYRIRHRASMIALWIGGAYFFASSTSFANPAVTVGRIFTDSFAGISPASVLPFIGAQLGGALLAWLILKGIAQSLHGTTLSSGEGDRL